MFGIGIWPATALAANAFEVSNDDDHFRPVCVGVVPHRTIVYILNESVSTGGVTDLEGVYKMIDTK